jgi:hypothetical protein
MPIHLVSTLFEVLLNHCCRFSYYQFDHFHCHIVRRSKENMISDFAVDRATAWIKRDVVRIAQPCKQSVSMSSFNQDKQSPAHTFFMNVHCNILLWIEWLLCCFVLDKLDLFLSVLTWYWSSRILTPQKSPLPRTSPTCGNGKTICFSDRSSFSPIAATLCTRFSSWMTLRTSSAARQLTGCPW